MQVIQCGSFSVLELQREFRASTSIFMQRVKCECPGSFVLSSVKMLSPDKRKTITPTSFKVRNQCEQECATWSRGHGKTFTSVVCNACLIEDDFNPSTDGNLTINNAERWNESLQQIVNLGFSSEEAGKVLRKAFGYENSAYWGQEKAKVLPDPEVVQAILDYLRELGLSDSDLLSVLKKFPELLGCSLETDLQINVGILAGTWGATGARLKNTIMRKPHVLGYNVDCKGDCMALCTRCWARF